MAAVFLLEMIWKRLNGAGVGPAADTLNTRTVTTVSRMCVRMCGGGVCVKGRCGWYLCVCVCGDAGLLVTAVSLDACAWPCARARMCLDVPHGVVVVVVCVCVCAVCSAVRRRSVAGEGAAASRVPVQVPQHRWVGGCVWRRCIPAVVVLVWLFAFQNASIPIFCCCVELQGLLYS